MYSTIWAPVLGELLSSKRELNNAKDWYIVAVCRVDSTIIDHIPKKIFLCAVFIKRGGIIQCIVSAIYHHILLHHDSLLWCCKIVRRALLIVGGFIVTTIYRLPCWPPQLNSREPVYLMDRGDLDIWYTVTFSLLFEVL